MSNLRNKEDLERAALIEKVSHPDYELPADAEIASGTAEGRAEVLAMLLHAAETPQEQEMVRKAGGRPALDPSGSASVSWRLRVPATLDQEFRALVETEGRSSSDVLRSAAQEYVSAHTPRGREVVVFETDGGWVVVEKGPKRSSGRFARKRDAVAHAKRVAQDLGKSRKSSSS